MPYVTIVLREGRSVEQKREMVKAITEAGLKVKVIIGGAPISHEYAREIGADGYAPDAGSAVDAAMALL